MCRACPSPLSHSVCVCVCVLCVCVCVCVCVCACVCVCVCACVCVCVCACVCVQGDSVHRLTKTPDDDRLGMYYYTQYASKSDYTLAYSCTLVLGAISIILCFRNKGGLAVHNCTSGSCMILH